MRAPKCLTIAGSDPSGGAGIQGDLKTFCALGAYGMAVITALTAQNGHGVLAVTPVESSVLLGQIDALLADMACDAVKIGMLATQANVLAVAKSLKSFPGTPLVLDPVLISTSGARLLESGAVKALTEHLIPLATIFTPNRAEASEILATTLNNDDELIAAAAEFHRLGAATVLIKGGDSNLEADEVLDVWYDVNGPRILGQRRIATIHTRGSGCALSAAICVGLARGQSPIESVLSARKFVHSRLAGALKVGQGRGPVNHLLLD